MEDNDVKGLAPKGAQSKSASVDNKTLGKQIEEFKRKKAILSKVEKLNKDKVVLESKLDRVNSKLAELLSQV